MTMGEEIQTRDLRALLAEVRDRMLALPPLEELEKWRPVDTGLDASPGIYAPVQGTSYERWVATFKRKTDRDLFVALAHALPRLLALAEGEPGAESFGRPFVERDGDMVVVRVEILGGGRGAIAVRTFDELLAAIDQCAGET